MIKKRIAYLGLGLILVGVLVLVFGAFGYYSQQDRQLELGAFDASVELPEPGHARAWTSGLLLTSGAVLVGLGLRKR
ncbi:MAG TPA: hypothetical protein VFW45_07675 [Candidatus Polarisedimenticolia bacterium]|nr:hypothetical protein [Candidatus Polarisedimenticolia bacterium]